MDALIIRPGLEGIEFCNLHLQIIDRRSDFYGNQILSMLIHYRQCLTKEIQGDCSCVLHEIYLLPSSVSFRDYSISKPLDIAELPLFFRNELVTR